MKNTLKQTAIFLLFMLSVQIYGQNVDLLWETEGLSTPESILYDHNNEVFYVSNVAGKPLDKDGNGFISLLNKDGSIQNLQWVTALHAPKGLGLYNNILYVSDIDELVAIDITSGKILNKYPAKGATFLNDVVVDKNGDVYVTDTFGGNNIFRLRNGILKLWIHDTALDYPNGLYISEGNLYVASWGSPAKDAATAPIPGAILKIDLESQEIESITAPLGNLDGLIVTSSGMLVSDWVGGKVHFVDKNDQAHEVLTLSEGTADIDYDAENGLLYIPRMKDDKVAAYKLDL